MGVFLLELKRGDRVAAEKVEIYLPHCLPTPFKFHSNCVQILFNQNISLPGVQRVGKLHARSPNISCERYHPGDQQVFLGGGIIFLGELSSISRWPNYILWGGQKIYLGGQIMFPVSQN